MAAPTNREPTRESARESASVNGKPKAPAPVIRANSDDQEQALWKRLLPAFVISGGFHVILAAFAVVCLFLFVPKGQTSTKVEILETQVAEEKEVDKDLITPEIGLDPEQELSNPVDRQEETTVSGENQPENPVGSPDIEVPTPETSPTPGDFSGLGSSPSTDGINGPPENTKVGGMGGTKAMGHRGDSGARSKLVTDQGGNALSEAAVAKGLVWLAKKQSPDGGWLFDGTPDHNPGTASSSGLALLPFLAAGETHKKAKKYQSNVYKGLAWLIGNQKPTGDFKGDTRNYGNPMATIALCEAYGMTLDPELQGPAQKALNFVMSAQAGNGSWGYSAGKPGDTSVVGWHVQALKSGVMANLSVSPDAFRKAGQFLDSCMSSQGTYGYAGRGGGDVHNLTAVGALLRMYMGWGPKNINLQKSVEFLKANAMPGKAKVSMYCWYYATQVMHFYGGDDWHVLWNPPMRDLLIETQEKGPDAVNGSWDEKGQINFGHGCGRTINTAIALLTLEVYYRHLPLYRRDGGGFKELERE